MYITRILVEKNNKYVFPHNAHVGEVKGDNFSSLYYLIRVEAVSYRKEHPGLNYWDLFYFVSDSPSDDITSVRCYVETIPNKRVESPTGVEIASWGGWKSIFFLQRRVETPLGDEWEDEKFEIEWKVVSELNELEKRVVNLAVEDARRRGFGPHGEVVSKPLPVE